MVNRRDSMEALVKEELARWGGAKRQVRNSDNVDRDKNGIISNGFVASHANA